TAVAKVPPLGAANPRQRCQAEGSIALLLSLRIRLFPVRFPGRGFGCRAADLAHCNQALSPAIREGRYCLTCRIYSTPSDASDSSRDGKSTCSCLPCACISSSSSKARNRRIFTAAYCSESASRRPCNSAQAATTKCGKKTLTAYVTL